MKISCIDIFFIEVFKGKLTKNGEKILSLYLEQEMQSVLSKRTNKKFFLEAKVLTDNFSQRYRQDC